jgi:hypothetical protein
MHIYTVLHTDFCMYSMPKNVHRSSLSWEILKIKNAPRGKNEKIKDNNSLLHEVSQVQKKFVANFI